MTELERPEIKHVILEMTLDEFSLIVACVSNTTQDLKAGPELIIQHPYGKEKMKDLLHITSKGKIAETLWDKLERMRIGCISRKHI